MSLLHWLFIAIIIGLIGSGTKERKFIWSQLKFIYSQLKYIYKFIYSKLENHPPLSIIFFVFAMLSFFGGIILSAVFWPDEWKSSLPSNLPLIFVYILPTILFLVGCLGAALFAAIGRGLSYVKDPPPLSIFLFFFAMLSFLGGIILSAAFWPDEPEYEWKMTAYILSIIWFMVGFLGAVLFAAIGQGLSYLNKIAQNTSK